MGFSKGATAALGTAFEPYRRRFGVVPGLRFQVHVTAYPWCGLQFRAIATTGAPILMLLGEADDYTRAQPCIDYAARIVDAGGKARAVVYRGAGHGFDGGEGPTRRLSGAENYGGCFAWIDDDTALIDPATNRRMPDRDSTRAFFATCRTLGGTVGVEPEAKRRAAEDALAFLRQSL
jgi:dienelactone hydrolase